MLSRPIAFGIVAAACVVAAGGGAYIATLQHARHDSVIAATHEAGPVTPAPEVSAQPRRAFPAAEAPDAPVGAPRVAAPAPAPANAARPVTQPSRVAAGKPAVPEKRTARNEATAPSPAASAQSSPDRGVPAPQIPAPSVDGGSAASKTGAAPAPLPSPATPEAQEPRVEPQRTFEELTVPSDAVIGLQLESSLNSESAHVEDRVDARITRDVRVDGRVAIPAGTHATGSVVLVERGGKIKDRSRLGIQFNTLVLPDSSTVKISTDTVYRDGESPGSKSSAKIGGAAIGGAIIGSILGGGKGAMIGSGIGAAGGTAAAMAGNRQPVVLPVGTPLSVRVQAPVTVTIEK